MFFIHPRGLHKIFYTTIHGDREFTFPKKSANQITCEMALSDLPPLEDELGEDPSDYASEPTNDYQRLMRARSNKVTNHVAAAHSERVKKIISLVPDGCNYKSLPEEYRNSRNFHVAWTRFASNKPAPTIDTGHRHHL